MAHARKLSWFDLPTDRPMPKIQRRRIIGDKMMVSDVRLEKGFELASHRHDNEQFVILLSGRCLFEVGDRGTPSFTETELRAGEVLVLPGGVAHSCRALEDSHILDLFSPISERTGVDAHSAPARP